MEERLQKIYEGFQQLKKEGFKVDACRPEAAIYLTIRLSLKGLNTAAGQTLSSQKEVTAYNLDEARLAVVPFYAFGASKETDWYHLSVGTCKKENIPEVFEKLRSALQQLQ